MCRPLTLSPCRNVFRLDHLLDEEAEKSCKLVEALDWYYGWRRYTTFIKVRYTCLVCTMTLKSNPVFPSSLLYPLPSPRCSFLHPPPGFFFLPALPLSSWSLLRHLFSLLLLVPLSSVILIRAPSLLHSSSCLLLPPSTSSWCFWIVPSNSSLFLLLSFRSTSALVPPCSFSFFLAYFRSFMSLFVLFCSFTVFLVPPSFFLLIPPHSSSFLLLPPRSLFHLVFLRPAHSFSLLFLFLFPPCANADLLQWCWTFHTYSTKRQRVNQSVAKSLVTPLKL